MATGHRLPNGYICILLTPREATLHRDQILAPEDYPWLNPSESQMVAMEIRRILESAVVEDSLQRLQLAGQEMINVIAHENEKKKMKAKGYWQCPECEYVNARENESCENCGKDKPEPQAEEAPKLP